MTFLPAFDEFSKSFAAGKPALVWTRWVADCETPVSAMLKVMREGEPCFLLESVHGGETRGRYSIIGLDPDILWRCKGNKAEMNSIGSLNDSDFTPCADASLASLKKLVRESTLTLPETLPPMAAGLIGYMGYDMVKLMEKLPDENPDSIGLPDSMFMRPKVMVIFDAVVGELFVITPLWKDHGFTDAKQAYDAAVARLTPVVERLLLPLPPGEGRGEGAATKKIPLGNELLNRVRELRKNTTDAEQLLWSILRDRQLEKFKFRRQHPIEPYIADFYCHEKKLVIELDGGQHAERENQKKDEARTRFLKKSGYQILRFWNMDVLKNIESVVEVILNSLTPALSQGEREELLFTPNMSQDAFKQMVVKAKEYIAAGDIFQVVPSQRFSAPFTLPPFALYRSLRHMNPSPFLFYLHFGNFSLVGSSPEILVRLRDGKVTIRPLAGTRKRGANKAEDDALIADLLADPKEIAEHLMLLDLGRNDVGRIAKTGTVKVTEQMVVEKYSHVMHIVSNVEGDIDPKYDAIDALIAGFPAGTVSGAPKIRAMEIIDELEPVKRSFYAGCVGYFSASGAMDNCITLRTGLIKDNVLYVQAGGGVVADSDPQAEYDESRNKAAALMRAAEKAGEFV